MSDIDLQKIYSGKVRDLYAIDNKRMLMVATDRLSAFDVILDEPIPTKGEILTQISNFWFDYLKDVMPNHFIGETVYDVLPEAQAREYEKRAVVVKKLTPIKIEAIVRGYLAGSGWKDYQNTGKLCGIDLPAGLQQAQQLPEVVFTPSTKAAVGEHDENISFAQAAEIIGEDLARQVQTKAIELYTADDISDLSYFAAQARTDATEAALFSTRESIQLHGGVGFTWEFDPHLFFRRAQASSQRLGTVEQWRELVAVRLLDEATEDQMAEAA